MIQYQDSRVRVYQSALYMTTSTMIETKEAIILVDPNWLPDEVERIRKDVQDLLGNRILYLILTHSDFDHILGAAAFPQATVIATEEFHRHPNKEEVQKKIMDFDQEFYCQRAYTPKYPDVDVVVKEDEQTLTIGDITLTFYKAKGHTNDGLFTVIEPLGIFITGDYLSDVEFPFIYSGYRDYIETMRKAETIFEKFSINTLIPGHGTVTTDRQEFEQRLQESNYYLEKLLDDSVEIYQFLSSKYSFYEGMKGTHEKNKEITRKEQKNNG